MEKKIIIINGGGGTGKDTFVSLCSEYAKVLNISAVDKVKEAARILVGWDGEKDEASRKMLSDLKKISIDYNDYPTKYIESMVNIFKQSDDNVMFIHIREASEIEKAKRLFGAKTLLISNPRVQHINSNYSDNNIDQFEYDYYIINDGSLDELKNKAKVFIENL